MKKLFYTILFLMTTVGVFAQDPSCGYVVILQDINTEAYTYEIIINDDTYNVHKDSLVIASQIRNQGKRVKKTVLRSKDHREILVGHQFGYCYPSHPNQNQLKILVSREDKTTNIVEYMYAFSSLEPGSYEIFVRSFSEGERDAVLYKHEVLLKDEKPTTGSIKS